MKFVIDDAKILFNGSNKEAKAILYVSQYLGDRSVKAEDANHIHFQGKIIETEDLIANETILIKFIGDELIAFLKMREDIYTEDKLVWDKETEVYRIGNYIFFNMKKDDPTVRKIKEMITLKQSEIKVKGN